MFGNILDFLQIEVLGWFVALDVWSALLAVAVFVVFFAVLSGFILSFFKERLAIIRLISALLATVSIVFFAFEKRDVLVANKYSSELSQAQNALAISKGWATDQAAAYCRAQSLSQALNQEAPLDNLARRAAMCTLTSEISRGLEAVDLIDGRQRDRLSRNIATGFSSLFPSEEPIELVEFNSLIADLAMRAQKLALAEENLKESQVFSRYLAIFILLFAAGAGLEIANENRDLFKDGRRLAGIGISSIWQNVRKIARKPAKQVAEREPPSGDAEANERESL